MWRYTCSQGEEAGTLNHELSHAAKAQQSLKKDLKISLGGTPSAFAISNYKYRKVLQHSRMWGRIWAGLVGRGCFTVIYGSTVSAARILRNIKLTQAKIGLDGWSECGRCVLFRIYAPETSLSLSASVW